MSFHSSKTKPQIFIHCDVCDKPILHREDGHVNWNGEGPFTFNHYGCGGPEVFNSDHYEYNTDISSWIHRLTEGCPSEQPPTDPLKVTLDDWLEEKRQEWEDAQYNERERIVFEQEQAAEREERRRRQKQACQPEPSEDWVAMSADELCNTDLSRKNEAEEL